MRACLRSMTLVIGLVVATSPLASADWPHIRGPRYDGVSAEIGLADAWPADGPRRIWARNLGQGRSGVIVGDGKLFTQRQSTAGQFLVCLDPLTGDVLWETRYARPWQLHGAYPGPYATPTFHGGKVYFASPTGLVGCADAATGTIDWSVDVQARFAGRGYGFGFAATPLVEDGRVILPVGGPNASLVAVDAASGETLWTAGSDPASYCPALPIEFGGRRFVVGYMENALVIVEPVRGTIVHRQKLSTGYDEHSAWPIYREPHLLLTAPFRAPAVCSRIEDGLDGGLALKPTWTSKHLSNDVASSVLYGDSVYGFDLKQLQSSVHRPSRGTFRCLDWATGDVRWSTDRVGHATVLAADGKLFLLTDAGELILARADPTKYEELARVSLFDGETCWTPPTLWRGRLFVRGPTELVCLDVVGVIDPIPEISNRPPPPKAAIWRIDPSRLLTREREFPNDAPAMHEAREWFGVSLLMLGVAATFALALHLIIVRALGRQSPLTSSFLAMTFVLGAIGPNLFSSFADRCLFTWPVSLFAALHATTLVCASDRAASPWPARFAIAAFVSVCAVYFVACRMVGMSIGWYYLFGLPFGAIFSALAARQNDRPRLAACWTMLAFAAFFWAGQALFVWKSSQAN